MTPPPSPHRRAPAPAKESFSTPFYAGGNPLRGKPLKTPFSPFPFL